MIQKTEYYYNADLGKVAKVPGSWEAGIRAAQTEMLLAQGYGLVPNYRQPVSQMPFAVVEQSFEPGENGTWMQVLVEKPLPVKLAGQAPAPPGHPGASGRPHGFARR